MDSLHGTAIHHAPHHLPVDPTIYPLPTSVECFGKRVEAQQQKILTRRVSHAVPLHQLWLHGVSGQGLSCATTDDDSSVLISVVVNLSQKMNPRLWGLSMFLLLLATNMTNNGSVGGGDQKNSLDCQHQCSTVWRAVQPACCKPL